MGNVICAMRITQTSSTCRCRRSADQPATRVSSLITSRASLLETTNVLTSLSDTVKGHPTSWTRRPADPPTRDRIAAVVTIAGAVLGSRLTEGVPNGVLDPLRDLKLGPCTVSDAGGVDSLRRSVRAAALTKLPPHLHAYSIAAASRQETTSIVLANGWRQLSAFSTDQDSQVIREDAAVPGGIYLGTAFADHWAVALPFERVSEFHPNTPPSLVKLFHDIVNWNHYPRAALFEAAARFVVADLNGQH
jgi:hypothetical protein